MHHYKDSKGEERVSEAALRTYLRKIERAYQAGNATEHTYRSALEELLRTFDPTVIATNEPKRIKCGAPDFIITNKKRDRFSTGQSL